MTRKTSGLGKRQQDFLRALVDHGKWYRGCGWIWSNESTTVALLESLHRRGLVERTRDADKVDVVWRPTARATAFTEKKRRADRAATQRALAAETDRAARAVRVAEALAESMTDGALSKRLGEIGTGRSRYSAIERDAFVREAAWRLAIYEEGRSET